MTDRSGWTDEQINEAIFKAKGWVELPPPAAPPYQRPTENGVESWFSSFPPDYAHDWRLAGGLFEEMQPYVHLWKTLKNWRCRRDNCFTTSSATPQRAICEGWLAWKDNKVNDGLV